MALKTFAPGVLTSSDVNTFLMKQAVITCTAATRPASPNEGMTIFETDTDRYLGYSGTAWENLGQLGDWTAYTPINGGGWTFGNATRGCYYIRFGRMVAVQFELTWGSTSSAAASAFPIALPIAGATLNSVEGLAAGLFRIVDVSTAQPYYVALHLNGTAFGFLKKLTYFAPNHIGESDVTNTAPFTWATGDIVGGFFVYRAAS